MLTLNAGQTWQRTVMPGAIRTSKLSPSLNKTEEMHKHTRESKVKLKPRQSPHRTSLSPVDTADHLAFPAWRSSVMSVLAVDVDMLRNLRSRRQAIIYIYMVQHESVVVLSILRQLAVECLHWTNSQVTLHEEHDRESIMSKTFPNYVVSYL